MSLPRAVVLGVAAGVALIGCQLISGLDDLEFGDGVDASAGNGGAPSGGTSGTGAGGAGGGASGWGGSSGAGVGGASTGGAAGASGAAGSTCVGEGSPICSDYGLPACRLCISNNGCCSAVTLCFQDPICLGAWQCFLKNCPRALSDDTVASSCLTNGGPCAHCAAAVATGQQALQCLNNSCPECRMCATDCTAEQVCVLGECKTMNGQPCSLDAECASGHCCLSQCNSESCP